MPTTMPSAPGKSRATANFCAPESETRSSARSSLASSTFSSAVAGSSSLVSVPVDSVAVESVVVSEVVVSVVVAVVSAPASPPGFCSAPTALLALVDEELGAGLPLDLRRLRHELVGDVVERGAADHSLHGEQEGPDEGEGDEGPANEVGAAGGGVEEEPERDREEDQPERSDHVAGQKGAAVLVVVLEQLRGAVGARAPRRLLDGGRGDEAGGAQQRGDSGGPRPAPLALEQLGLGDGLVHGLRTGGAGRES